MPVLTNLLLLIVSARLLGQIFQRFGQPAIVGEMLAGVLIGPSMLDLVEPNAALSGIAEFAVFLIVLSAGLEMNIKKVFSALRGKGLVIATIGFIIPLLSGIALGVIFQQDVMRSVFLGICISVTALPVAVSILQSFGLLDSDIAHYSIATAIFNDVFALLILGVILNLPEHQSLFSVGVSIVNASWKLIFLGFLIVGFNWLLEKMIENGIHAERISEKIVSLLGNEALFGILLVFVLIFGSISAALGFHFIIGAFFGALLIDRKFFLASRYKELDLTLKSIAGGFLAPVFFASLGLEFKIEIIESVLFVLAVLGVSIFSKIFSGWLGGRLIGLTQTQSLGIGIILNGRGVMELVIASIAYQRGFIGAELFSILILMGVVTTILTPFMFRKWVMTKYATENKKIGIK